MTIKHKFRFPFHSLLAETYIILFQLLKTLRLFLYSPFFLYSWFLAKPSMLIGVRHRFRRKGAGARSHQTVRKFVSVTNFLHARSLTRITVHSFGCGYLTQTLMHLPRFRHPSLRLESQFRTAEFCQAAEQQQSVGSFLHRGPVLYTFLLYN